MHAATMPPHLYTAEVAGFGRPTLRDQFAHVLATEVAWVRGLQLLPQRAASSPPQTVGETLREQERVAAETVTYLNSLDDCRLNTELDQLPAEWMGPRRSPAFIILHVVTHAFHHKGQIAAMMRLLGHPAPDTDMQRE